MANSNETLFSSIDAAKRFDPIIELDAWNLEEIKIDIVIEEHVSQRVIYFDSIELPLYKNTLKLYIYFRLMVGVKPNTALSDLSAIKKFITFCDEQFQLTSCSEVTREHITDYISYVKNSSNSKSWINAQLTALKVFIDTSCVIGLPNAFTARTIFPKNVRLRNEYSDPNPFSEAEVKRMLEKSEQLDLMTKRMLYIMASIPIRYSEIQGMRASQLLKSPDGYSLLIRMYKTREFKTVPIPESVGLMLEEHRDYVLKGKAPTSQEFYDPLMFKNRNNNSIPCKEFNRKLQVYIAKHKIMNDAGDPLHATSHRFRAYTTSKLISQGVDPVIVGMLLGHKTAHSLKRYAKIFPDKVHQLMKPVIDDRDWHIRNMGKILETRRKESGCPQGVKLTNGVCAKPVEAGICQHANACLNCVFFLPSEKHRESYLIQLHNARSDYDYAIREGFTRMAEYNLSLIEQLENVLITLDNQPA